MAPILHSRHALRWLPCCFRLCLYVHNVNLHRTLFLIQMLQSMTKVSLCSRSAIWPVQTICLYCQGIVWYQDLVRYISHSTIQYCPKLWYVPYCTDPYSIVLDGTMIKSEEKWVGSHLIIGCMLELLILPYQTGNIVIWYPIPRLPILIVFPMHYQDLCISWDMSNDLLRYILIIIL